MSIDPEDRFELPRKFQHGVIRRDRCDRADLEPFSATGSVDPQGFATWRSIDRIVAADGPAAAVRSFAASSAEDKNFSGHNWGRRSFYDSHLPDRRWPLLLRLLDLVRSATDEEYFEAVAVAEKMRDEYPVPASRAAMAVLAPERPEWCSADIADYAAQTDVDNYVARLLMLACTTREQARELGRKIKDWNWVNDDRRAEGTFLAAIDAGADEFLIGCLERDRWHALNLLPKLPSDLAVSTLIGELGPKDAQAALLEAAKRFPRRVLRLLAEAEPATQVDYVLRLHVAAGPEVAREQLPRLSEVGRERVQALLNRIDGSGSGAPSGEDPISIAAEADLPHVLVVPPWADRKAGKPIALKNLPAPAPFFRWPAQETSGPAAIPEPAPTPAEAGNQNKIVQTMAEWLHSEYAPYAEAADVFFRRYPEEAVRQLLVCALGPAGPERRTAEAVVRFAAREGLADVVALAGETSPEAAVATQAVLDRRGLDMFPKSMPAVPLWADPASLPRILLAGRTAVLPTSAVRFVVQMLTISSHRDVGPYGGIEIVQEACDTDSLAEFAWGLFENWAGAGYPTKKLGWAFDTLLWFGNEETARRLAPLVRAWPGEGGSARAAAGLDVLIAVGGEAGLREVYDISQRSPFTALRAEASRRVAKAAGARGLSADQFGGPARPGPGRRAGRHADAGLRRAPLRRRVRRVPGAVCRRRDRQAPRRTAETDGQGRRDTGSRGTAALHRAEEGREDVRGAAGGAAGAGDGVRAPVVGRRVPVGVRRAPVAAVGGAACGLGRSSTGTGCCARCSGPIAEDGDVRGRRRRVSRARPGGHRRGAPGHLAAELTRWAEICHDYEIIQPFPQVGRPTFALTSTECEATRLDRFCDAQLPTDRLLALHRTPGWGGAALWDSGSTVATGRRLPGPGS